MDGIDALTLGPADLAQDLGVFGTPDPLLALPRLAAYWKAIQTDPIIARILDETRQGILVQQQTARDRAAKAV